MAPTDVSSHVATLSSHVLPRTLHFLSARSTSVPVTGVTKPTSIPNTAVFILFGLIGAGFVFTGIWFFFIAPNGGFVFQESDWEDYKSSVLRRKGPNGTTLSGATESTDLGGGSIVGKKGRRQHRGHGRYTDVEKGSSGTESEMKRSEKAPKWKKKSAVVGKKARMTAQGGINRDDDMETVVSEQPEEVVRAYRHEKPARVGGLNQVADSRAFGSTTDGSDLGLLYNREESPKNSPMKKSTGGIRQVQSSGTSTFWATSTKQKTAATNAEASRIKEEAKRLQEKGRAARRDFSFTQEGHLGQTTAEEERKSRREARRASRSPEKRVPGSWVAGVAASEVGSEVGGGGGGSDVSGTKSYHHPLPGLSAGYAEERRKARREAGGVVYRS